MVKLIKKILSIKLVKVLGLKFNFEKCQYEFEGFYCNLFLTIFGITFFRQDRKFKEKLNQKRNRKNRIHFRGLAYAENQAGSEVDILAGINAGLKMRYKNNQKDPRLLCHEFIVHSDNDIFNTEI